MYDGIDVLYNRSEIMADDFIILIVLYAPHSDCVYKQYNKVTALNLQ